MQQLSLATVSYLTFTHLKGEMIEGQSRKTSEAVDVRGRSVGRSGVKKRNCMESVCEECAVAMRMKVKREQAQNECCHHYLREDTEPHWVYWSSWLSPVSFFFTLIFLPAVFKGPRLCSILRKNILLLKILTERKNRLICPQHTLEPLQQSCVCAPHIRDDWFSGNEWLQTPCKP